MTRLAIILGVTLTAVPASAQAPQLEWEDHYPEFHTAELAATAFFGVAAWGFRMFVVPDLGDPGRGVLLDEPVREALRLETREDRTIAARFSDALAPSLIVWPMADTAAVWGLEGNPDVAEQMFLINLLSYAVNAAFLDGTKNLVRRPRPYHRECEEEPFYDSGCRGPDRLRSFFSGHASWSFTGAGLTCVHHVNLPIYGSGFGNTLACATALAAATTVAVLRIVADKHYLSDVTVGAVVGLLAGFVLPSVLHYGFDFERPDVGL